MLFCLFYPLNPPGLPPARDDGREFIPSTRNSEWALSLQFDVFAMKRSCVYSTMPKILSGCDTDCLYSTLTCCMFFKSAYAEPWETFSYFRRCVCVLVVRRGGPCIFESLILQVITQQCKLQRGSKEPWPLPALAWPCIRSSCLTLQLTA